MTVKIRLARGGSKKNAHYSIVVANSRSARNGKFLEKVGHYHPLVAKDSVERVVLFEERISYWLGVGAQPTEVVAKFLIKRGIAGAEKFAKELTKTKYHGMSKEQIKEAKKSELDLLEATKKAKAEKAKADTAATSDSVAP